MFYVVLETNVSNTHEASPNISTVDVDVEIILLHLCECQYLILNRQQKKLLQGSLVTVPRKRELVAADCPSCTLTCINLISFALQVLSPAMARHQRHKCMVIDQSMVAMVL